MTLFINASAQNFDTVRGYIFDDTLRFHTIEEVLKVGKVNVRDTSIRIIKFTWVITGKTNGASFGVNEGETFNSDLITYFEKYKSDKYVSFVFNQFTIEYKHNLRKKVFMNAIAHNTEKIE